MPTTTVNNPRYAEIYRDCLRRAAAEGEVLMELMAAVARQNLSSGGANKDLKGLNTRLDSVPLLNQYEQQLRKRYPEALAAAFVESGAADKPVVAQRAVPSFDDLELMDETQVQESVEIARAQQTAILASESSLTELNSLISAAQGHRTVHPDRNPLRPDIFIKALRTIMGECDVDPAVRLSWLHFMGTTLGKELNLLYKRQITFLREAGVTGASYSLNNTNMPGAEQTASAVAAALAPPPAGAPGAAGAVHVHVHVPGGGVVTHVAPPAPPGVPGAAPPVSGQLDFGSDWDFGGTEIMQPHHVRTFIGGAAPTDPNLFHDTEHGKRTREETLLTVDQLRRLLAGELDARVDALEARIGIQGDEPTTGSGALGRSSGRASLRGGLDNKSAPAMPTAPAPEPQPDFGHTVPAAFEVLEQMNQVEHVMDRLSQRRGKPLTQLESMDPAISLRQELRSTARGVGQALGLEVVNLMVENIAKDNRLLVPVQNAVRAMEPALLRLAMIDPRFFSDKQHPARRLLEQMTERSLAFERVDSPGFDAFMEPLVQVTGALASAPVEGPEPFEIALRSLEEFWSDSAKTENRKRRKAVQALLHAEQRNLLAEKIARDLRARPETALAPASIVNFVCGPWSQVLAQARLLDTEGQSDPNGYMALVNDLLWSTQPELARNNTAKLTRMIPVLFTRIRKGLSSIDFPPEESSGFFSEMTSLHGQALQSGNAARTAMTPLPEIPKLSQDASEGSGATVTAGESIATPASAASKMSSDVPVTSSDEPATLPPATEIAEEQEPGTWLAPSEALQSGFMSPEEAQASVGGSFHETGGGASGNAKSYFPDTDLVSDDTVQEPLDDEETADRAARAAEYAAAEPTPGSVYAIALGAWVELKTKDRWVRTQLTWTSPYGTLFMFTDADGIARSMTRRSLDRLQEEGAIRLLGEQNVVAGALNAVAEKAMRNSVDVNI